MVEDEEDADTVDPDWIPLSDEDEDSPSADRCSAAYFLVSRDALLKLLRRCTECGALMDTELRRGAGGAAVTAAGRCPAYSRRSEWRSSELVPGTKIARVDLLVSSAILFTGSEVSQALRLFKFMEVAVGTPATFHRHQVAHLHKAIRYVWRQKQQEHLESLRGKQELVLGGDGRHSTVGHCALYYTYSVKDTASRKLVHVEQVHVSICHHYSLISVLLLILIISLFNHFRTPTLLSSV